jgi:hypothetical protein
VNRHCAAKLRTVLAAFAILGCIGCNRDKMQRTTPIAPRVVAAVTSADSVEVYEILDIHSATRAAFSNQAYYSESRAVRRPATGPTEELFSDDQEGTHLIVSPIGTLNARYRRAAARLLLRSRSYTNDHWLCIPRFRYVLRYRAQPSAIYVVLTDDCIEVDIRDAGGKHLDGGSVSTSAVRKWEHIIEGIESGS